MENPTKCKIIFAILILSIIGIILFLGLFVPSIRRISYNEYAFKQDRFGQVDIDHVYTRGRYYIPINYIMVKLPSTYQLIEISSSIFSNLGLEFDLNLVVYYQLPKENLGKIYRQFSKNYEDRIINIVKTTIKDAATFFSVNNYVTNRTYIQDTFSQEVHSQLTTLLGIDISSLYFRLLHIDFPESVIESSLLSAIELQNNKIKNLQQEVAIIEADTKQIIANINAQTNATVEFANIGAQQIVDNSLSEANKIITAARGEGIKLTLDIIGITSPVLIDEFIKLVSILDSDNPKILSGNFNTFINV